MLLNSENRRVDLLLEQLHALESVINVLQQDLATVSDTRSLSCAVIERYTDTTNPLTPSAYIVLYNV